jgi:hypothetical protein
MNVEKKWSTEKVKATILNIDCDRSKQPDKLEYFSCLGSRITSGARCTCEVTSKIAMAKQP